MAEQRYIGSSERTKTLAEGIYLYAKWQDKATSGCPEREAYERWAAQWGTEMDVTARQEQFNLFDRVNGREWG